MRFIAMLLGGDGDARHRRAGRGRAAAPGQAVERPAAAGADRQRRAALRAQARHALDRRRRRSQRLDPVQPRAAVEAAQGAGRALGLLQPRRSRHRAERRAARARHRRQSRPPAPARTSARARSRRRIMCSSPRCRAPTAMSAAAARRPGIGGLLGGRVGGLLGGIKSQEAGGEHRPVAHQRPHHRDDRDRGRLCRQEQYRLRRRRLLRASAARSAAATTIPRSAGS